ncbi:MAG: efflux RND transporter permease subunit, partial [Thiomicrospira sp.]
MAGLIAATLGRARSIGLILLMLLISGSYAYFTMAKEAAPEIYIPLFTVSVSYPGISAQDSARLLVEPLERKFQSLKGLRKMTARAGEGFASLLLEFDPGFDQQRALQSVRDETDNATPDLPNGVERPIIREIDISLFPILTLTLSGEVAERELTRIARELEQQLETLNGVLEADISGIRDEVVEIVLDPLALQSYGISPQEIQRAISNNNQLITAGNIDNGAGRIGLSVPGRIETIKDIEQMPVKVIEQRVVRVKDVAQVRQTYQDADSLARVNNRPTIAIDIRKTSGANIIDTVAQVKALIETQRTHWPAQLHVDYLPDHANTIQTLLSDLQNNVIAAVLLVALTMLIALGFSAALLVSVAIPGA